MHRVNSMAAHVVTAGRKLQKVNNAGGFSRAHSTTDPAAVMDTYGNAWRVHEGTIQRTDCYLIQPWSAVQSPTGVTASGCALVRCL